MLSGESANGKYPEAAVAMQGARVAPVGVVSLPFARAQARAE